jgi:probable rRNA maturation factor
MHELNRRHLDHDYPTDVLSFTLEDDGKHLEGEVVISADTAEVEAAERGWTAAGEQLLYVVHGILHLVGYRDKSPAEIEEMRAAEEMYLRRFGFKQPVVTRDTQVATRANRAAGSGQGEAAL